MKNLSFLLLLTFLLLASCTSTVRTKYYEPAVLKSDISYLPKPISADTVKSSVYMSAGYHQKQTSLEESADMVHMFQLFLNRAHTFRHINIAYGASGLTGYLKNNMIEAGESNYFKTKPFHSLVLRGSVNTYIKKNNIDYRWLGAEFAYSREYGAFKDFRSEVYRQPDFFSIINHETFTAGLSSEVIFHNPNTVSNQLGVRLFAGKTFSNLTYLGMYYIGDSPINANPFIATLALFIQLNRLNIVLEGGGSTAQGRIGYRF